MSRARVQELVGKAFDRNLSDAVSEFTGVRTTVGEYDPISGTTPRSIITYGGRGVMGGFTVEEAAALKALVTDVKLTALQNETTEEPQEGDIINNLKVVRVKKDPFGATWTLALRRT